MMILSLGWYIYNLPLSLHCMCYTHLFIVRGLHKKKCLHLCRLCIIRNKGFGAMWMKTVMLIENKDQLNDRSILIMYLLCNYNNFCSFIWTRFSLTKEIFVVCVFFLFFIFAIFSDPSFNNNGSLWSANHKYTSRIQVIKWTFWFWVVNPSRNVDFWLHNLNQFYSNNKKINTL